MFYFWVVNLINFFSHFYALVPAISEHVPLDSKQDRPPESIKND